MPIVVKNYKRVRKWTRYFYRNYYWDIIETYNVTFRSKAISTEPNILLSQLVLAFVASALGSLLVPALIERSYTSITFLSLAAQQFRQVRDNRRDTLQNLEDVQLIQRGNAFIEEIARTYEVRNYTCIVTSFLTVGIYYIISSEFKLGDTTSNIISSICGLVLAFILKNYLQDRVLVI